jgi:predicted nucleic acid-binding protein
LRNVGRGQFEIAVSVPLVLEYEAAAMRLICSSTLTRGEIEGIIDYLCSQAIATRISYLWRPQLPDPNDDMVLETAIAAGCDTIVTYNARDFVAVQRFGIEVETPQIFLNRIGVVE